MAAYSRRRAGIEQGIRTLARANTGRGEEYREVSIWAEDFDFLRECGALIRDGASHRLMGGSERVVRGPGRRRPR